MNQVVVRDLGRMGYRQAWAIQEQVHEEVSAGGRETILLVEHLPVITLGRRPEIGRNLLVSEEELARLGVEMVQSDRGGDITFHGPGQIVAYPIVRLADHQLSVSGYVHRLEAIVIAALGEIGIESRADPEAVGIWTEDGGEPAKVCAIGVRIRRGVTMHGLALNVRTDLRFFDLIVPCGLHRPVTSVGKLLGEGGPGVEEMKGILRGYLVRAFSVGEEGVGGASGGSVI